MPVASFLAARSNIPPGSLPLGAHRVSCSPNPVHPCLSARPIDRSQCLARENEQRGYPRSLGVHFFNASPTGLEGGGASRTDLTRGRLPNRKRGNASLLPRVTKAR